MVNGDLKESSKEKFKVDELIQLKEILAKKNKQIKKLMEDKKRMQTDFSHAYRVLLV